MLQKTSVTFDGVSAISSSCDLGINQVVAILLASVDNSTLMYLLVSDDNQSFEYVRNEDGSLFTLLTIETGGYRVISPQISYALPRFLKVETDAVEPANNEYFIFAREV
jgi:hypothetical protein